MTHIITELVLDKLRTYCSKVYGKVGMQPLLETRDFHHISSDDEEIRRASHFQAENKLIINAAGHDPVTFQVSGGSSSKKKACQCKWRSAHCAFKFHYDVFRRDDSGVLVVYLEISLFNQQCRKHQRQATSIHVSSESEECFSDIFREYLQDLFEKVPETRPQAAAPQKLIENVEEDKEDSEERLLESILAYETQLKQNAEKADLLMSNQKRTKGKHVSSLC